jgi:hypothetical protein
VAPCWSWYHKLPIKNVKNKIFFGGAGRHLWSKMAQGCPLEVAGHDALLKMPSRSTTLLLPLRTLLVNQCHLSSAWKTGLHRHWFKSPAKRCFVTDDTHIGEPISSRHWRQSKENHETFSDWWEMTGLPMCVPSSNKTSFCWQFHFAFYISWVFCDFNHLTPGCNNRYKCCTGAMLMRHPGVR